MKILKIFFVTILLTAATVTLIFLMDIFLGFNLTELMRKLRKPYEVPEASEYVVIIGFISFFLIKFIINFLKKKMENNPTAN